jgi:hypothetical protein
MKHYVVYPAKEARLWLILFLIANLLNAYSIYHYKTSWKELYTQLGYVFLLSLALYLVVTVIRRIFVLSRRKHEA